MQFSSQPVPTIRKFPQTSYWYPSKGRQNANYNHRKLTKLITWITVISNSMKISVMLWRATQEELGMVESSDNMWSTSEGNGRPLQYSCLENPMSCMKWQKYMALKDELPRLVHDQYANGEELRNSSRRNKEAEPQWKQAQLWICLEVETKSNAVKNNIA